MELRFEHIYFVGIGGIGMSALARYFLARGSKVSGYDKTRTPLTDQLSKEGMHIVFDESPEYIPYGIDLVVYTPAVPSAHKGLTYFRNTGIPVIKRAEVLGLISKNTRCIAIAGTHGKTTTSALTAHVLHESGMGISAFLGGILSGYNSNLILGDGAWTVMEADEFDRSFLHLEPEIAVIMSMDPDHLDIYGNTGDFYQGFRDFAGKIRRSGKLLIKKGLLNNFSLDDIQELRSRQIEIIEFGWDSGNVVLSNPVVKHGIFGFDYHFEETTLENIEIFMPGKHNAENASVAVTIALLQKIDQLQIRNSMRNFKGIQRRFEKIFESDNVVYIDDYAHHPTELDAAISTARLLYPKNKITGIFQPHLYSRTRDFSSGFARALDQLDEIYLLEIYPARELPVEGVTSMLIFNQMRNSQKHLVTKESIMDSISFQELEILLTLGAGDIDTLVIPLREKLISVYGKI